MATRDVPPSESLSPLPNKVRDRMSVLKEVIENKKSLVRRVADEMKTRIDERTLAVLRELDTIWEKVSTLVTQKREEMEKKISELTRYKEEMETIFRELNEHPALNQVSDSIVSVRQKLDVDIPFVSLTWKLNELRECIDGMCVCNTRSVILRDDTPVSLKWGCVEKGKEEHQINNPQSIAIDVMSDRVYVACRNPDRIQIFSRNGKWIQCLKNEQLIYPEYLLCLNNSLFIQCNSPILKFNTSTLQRQSYKHYECALSGICTDNTLLYVSQWGQMKLYVLSQELEEKNTISLNTTRKQDNTRIRDLCYTREEFYVSFSDSDYTLQAFSKHGELTRCIIHKDTVRDVTYFCIDQQMNIIISDRNSSNIMIASNDGKVITQFGKEGTAKGEFQCVCGVAVDDSYSIISVDGKYRNKLQSFSPS